jgi:hypothetical protein
MNKKLMLKESEEELRFLNILLQVPRFPLECIVAHSQDLAACGGGVLWQRFDCETLIQE